MVPTPPEPVGANSLFCESVCAVVSGLLSNLGYVRGLKCEPTPVRESRLGQHSITALGPQLSYPVLVLCVSLSWRAHLRPHMPHSVPCLASHRPALQSVLTLPQSHHPTAGIQVHLNSSVGSIAPLNMYF